MLIDLPALLGSMRADEEGDRAFADGMDATRRGLAQSTRELCWSELLYRAAHGSFLAAAPLPEKLENNIWPFTPSPAFQALLFAPPNTFAQWEVKLDGAKSPDDALAGWTLSRLSLVRAQGRFTVCLARRDLDGIPQTIAVAAGSVAGWDVEPGLVLPSAD